MRSGITDEQCRKLVEPHDADLWRWENLNQAIGTVAWAHQVGDAAFEQSGRDMLDRLFSGT